MGMTFKYRFSFFRLPRSFHCHVTKNKIRKRWMSLPYEKKSDILNEEELLYLPWHTSMLQLIKVLCDFVLLLECLSS